MNEHSGDSQTRESSSEAVPDADGGGDESTSGDEVQAADDTTVDESTSGDGVQAADDTTVEIGPADLLDTLGEGGTAVDNLPGPDEVDPGDRLHEQADTASTGAVVETLAVLGERVDTLETELRAEHERAEDLESRLRRKQADFQNYKKRKKEEMAEQRERATEDLVERLLDVRDNLVRALETDADADIRGGIESTLAQFDRELDHEGVDAVDPAPGDPVDPVRHEVLATVPSDEPEDAIADIHRPGYEMAGKLLRPAQVTVSDGQVESADNTTDGEDSDTGNTTGDDGEGDDTGSATSGADGTAD
ncbi:MAG: molecular chaperone GrpE, heat shock protein [halophilic archaeon J07HX64]|jgi:Molecular chaperone GrpE (heat shock protein)|nr:MAG: molecular chaperone GrpE, heat shock protein [halophilic archaeon J07HX64]